MIFKFPLMAALFLAAWGGIVATPAAQAAEKVRVVMLGDSLTAGCKWQARFPEAKVINQGIGGDTTTQIMARLDKVVEAKPDIIFLQAGINDFGRKPALEDILERHQAIWAELSQKLPQSKIYVISLLPVVPKRYPRWNEPIVKFNQMLKEAVEAKGLVFIDLHSQLKDQDGTLLKELTFDGLHLKNKAYDLWVAAINPILIKLRRLKHLQAQSRR